VACVGFDLLFSPCDIVMSLHERLKNFDAHSSVSKEFRVYTVHGAVLSVVTVLAIVYLVISEARFNFEVIIKESVHVNATSSRGLEMEFDITFPEIQCSKLQIDANDQQGQSQSLHLDKEHHVWKHRIKVYPHDGVSATIHLIGERKRLELGSTLKNEKDLVEIVEKEGKIGQKPVEVVQDECGSCYGAGEEGECCSTCEDVRRAYKRRGWVLQVEEANIVQCKNEVEGVEQEGEGCNVHGIVALSTGGGNLHLAPGKDAASGGMTLLEGTWMYLPSCVYVTSRWLTCRCVPQL
jgi:endoplasmic reticulum-Golgi intermediate compartment protein 3